MATKKYRVKPGQKHYARSEKGNSTERYEGGQLVSLTDAQYESFKDKFDPCDDTAAELAKKAETKEAAFVVSRAGKSKTKYNVVNTHTEKPMNEELLSKEDADKLCAQLLKGESSD